MIFKYDAAIIGGDLRQIYLANILDESGYNITVFGLNSTILNPNLIISDSAEQAILSSKIIIAPIPFSRDKINITGLSNDITNNCSNLTIEELLTYLLPEHYLIGGNITNEVTRICEKNNILYLDLMKIPDISILNAIATAEGAIAESIFKSDINLHQSNVLVLGYGKCGKVLSSKLHALGAKVTICARRKDVLAEAFTNNLECLQLEMIISKIKNYNYIFNTIPAIILNEKILLELSPETIIIDIASSPGGVDYETAQKLNIKAYLHLGLPGRISPLSSAQVLADVILPILKERND